MSNIITIDEIVKADDRKWVDVPVDEWQKGKVVRLGVMTAKSREIFEAAVQKRMRNGKLTDSKGLKFYLLARSIIDENGSPLFNDETIKQLGEKSSVVVERLFEAAQKLNGIGSETVEEMRKN